MQPQIDYTKLVPSDEFSGDDAEDDALLKEMIERGRSYLSSFEWCRTITECYVGDIAIGGIVAVLLFRIEPARKVVDEWLWVVVGDLPPAHIVVDDAPTPAAALKAYVAEMDAWVKAVKAGNPVNEFIPVATDGGALDLEPAPELADDLERRIRFLKESVLSEYPRSSVPRRPLAS